MKNYFKLILGTDYFITRELEGVVIFNTSLVVLRFWDKKVKYSSSTELIAMYKYYMYKL